jgi:hypothetical protein
MSPTSANPACTNKLVIRAQHCTWNNWPPISKIVLNSRSLLRIMMTGDECQILCIWTPWFTLVRPLALLFYDALVSFYVFMFCMSISEEWQNSCGIAWKIRKFWRTRSIDQNFPELTFAKARQNTQSGVSAWQKAVLPLIFAAEHASFVFLVVSSKRGTLKGARGVILHGFLALISFYKSHIHASLLESSENSN